MGESALIEEELLHIPLRLVARKVMCSKFPYLVVYMFGNNACIGEAVARTRKRFLFLLTLSTPGNIWYGGKGKRMVLLLDL